MPDDASLVSWSLGYDQIKPKHARLDAVADAMIGYTDPTSLAKQDKGKALANKQVDTASIQQAKAWEAAIAPVKSIPMNLMMLYMSGNSVQIFSMMVVYMTVVNPLKGITTVNAVFAPYQNPKHTVLPQMLVFIVCQLACTSVGLYKCWSMGLLPTEASDWLAWYKTPSPLEYTPRAA
ncbi:hypothetical protein MBRA1_003351 [Malassezia brasiliensis]|uniref:ER membrane protein complex subunit 4 n=1 Tax=Malassezia brasiliensis TaxID=1821822 RepID=A0AAF0DV43_9BASI|nr:hypothetical protein MBRA1_003351 [Malassezia brasiliensis]